MGKDLKGKDLGVGITQQKNGLYNAGFVDKLGKRRVKRFKKLQECRKWLDEAKYIDEHSSITEANTMMVDAWFEYWISIKEKTVRPNTVRNYRERYHRNISKVIGKMLLVDVKPIHCQKIFSDMADEGYKTTTIYQTRITLYNMLDFAKEDEAIRILKAQKEKNSKIKVIAMEWADQVFLCRKGEPVKNSTYDTALFKLCDKVGIKRFSMHILRHTFAIRCIEAGMMPKTLQKILGHSNIGITMNLYVHITEDEKHKEIELVAGALKVISVSYTHLTLPTIYSV